MIGGVIVGHRDIGESMCRALESIAGKFKNLVCISNEGLSTAEIAEEIKGISNTMRADGLFIFVDVYGGSCWRAAKLAKPDKAHIITGINLPMMLSFIHKRESFSFHELADVLETDGKRGVTSE